MTAAAVGIITVMKVASEWNPPIRCSGWSGARRLEPVLGLAPGAVPGTQTVKHQAEKPAEEHNFVKSLTYFKWTYLSTSGKMPSNVPGPRDSDSRGYSHTYFWPLPRARGCVFTYVWPPLPASCFPLDFVV